MPALFWGCVPVMSDRLEGMPLEELPDLDWNASTLAIDHAHLESLPQLLQALPAGREDALRAAGGAMVPRMLYTTYEFSDLPGRSVGACMCSPRRSPTPLVACRYEFSDLPGRSVGCSGCAAHRHDCARVNRPGPRGLVQRGQMNAAHRRKLAPLMEYMRVDEGEQVCGRTSYLGESMRVLTTALPPPHSLHAGLRAHLLLWRERRARRLRGPHGVATAPAAGTGRATRAVERVDEQPARHRRPDR